MIAPKKISPRSAKESNKSAKGGKNIKKPMRDLAGEIALSARGQIIRLKLRG